jgi:hypothetical protein
MKSAERTFRKITDQDFEVAGSRQFYSSKNEQRAIFSKSVELRAVQGTIWQLTYHLISGKLHGTLATFGGRLKVLEETRHEARKLCVDLLANLHLLAPEMVVADLPMFPRLQEMFPHGKVSALHWRKAFLNPNSFFVQIGDFEITVKEYHLSYKKTWKWSMSFHGSKIVFDVLFDTPEEFLQIAIPDLMMQTSLLMDAINE